MKPWGNSGILLRCRLASKKEPTSPCLYVGQSEGGNVIR